MRVRSGRFSRAPTSLRRARHGNTIDTTGRGSYDTGHPLPLGVTLTQGRGGTIETTLGFYYFAYVLVGLAVVALKRILDSPFGAEAWPIVLGAIFSAFVLFLPKGIWGTLTGGIHGRQSA